MFFKFVIVGGIGFLVDFSILFGLIYCAFSPMEARFISFPLALITTFFLNKFFAFQNKEALLKQFIQYIIASLAGIAINLGSYKIFLYDVNPQISVILSSATALICNFLLYKYVVFRPKK